MEIQSALGFPSPPSLSQDPRGDQRVLRDVHSHRSEVNRGYGDSFGLGEEETETGGRKGGRRKEGRCYPCPEQGGEQPGGAAEPIIASQLVPIPRSSQGVAARWGRGRQRHEALSAAVSSFLLSRSKLLISKKGGRCPGISNAS